MIRIYESALPAGWEERELRKVVELKRGYSWSKEQESTRPEPGTVPVVRIMNVRNAWFCTLYCTLETSAKRICPCMLCRRAGFYLCPQTATKTASEIRRLLIKTWKWSLLRF